MMFMLTNIVNIGAPGGYSLLRCEKKMLHNRTIGNLYCVFELMHFFFLRKSGIYALCNTKAYIKIVN